LKNNLVASSRLNLDTALARRITVVLLLKLCILFSIWKLWFSNPHAEDMSLPAHEVQERLLGPADTRR
jgi:hypothetical protein